MGNKQSHITLNGTSKYGIPTQQRAPSLLIQETGLKNLKVSCIWQKAAKSNVIPSCPDLTSHTDLTFQGPSGSYIILCYTHPLLKLFKYTLIYSTLTTESVVFFYESVVRFSCFLTWVTRCCFQKPEEHSPIKTLQKIFDLLRKVVKVANPTEVRWGRDEKLGSSRKIVFCFGRFLMLWNNLEISSIRFIKD